MRLRLSYRVSLVIAIPLLVLLTGGTLTLRSYLRTRTTIETIARDLFGEVSRQTVQQTRSFLGDAATALEVLTRLDRRAISATDDEAALMPRLSATLLAHPAFSWVSYGDEEGSFAGIYRPDARTVRMNRSRIHPDGRTELFEHDVLDDGTLREVTHNPSSGYDPRTRPFYTAAAERRGRIWTPPYVFPPQNVPGITCAQAQLDAAGAIAGVYTVDFDLAALSEFVRSLELSPHGKVFVFNDARELLAHPTANLSTSRGSELALVHIEEAEDEVTRAFAAAIGDRLEDRDVRFTAAGQEWLGRLTTFEVEGGLRWHVAALAPELDFLGELQRENQIALLIGAVAILLAVFLSVVMANRIAQPLEVVAREMEAVGRFDIERPDPSAGSMFREIDVLQRTLASMKKGLSSFARFVPRDVVRTLLASGQEAELGGQVREVTLFFSDLAGFTTLAESIEPDALVRQLGGYLEVMTRTIGQGGGTVDKFIGDGIMAFWGAPLDDAQHAARACETAIICQRRLEDAAKQPGSEWLASTHTRIGLATGSVVVGNVGIPERMNYTAMGDTVNLSARLESLNKQYGTLVMAAESAVRAAGDRVIARVLDIVAVKGKATGIEVYELIGLPGDEDARAKRELAQRSREAFDAYLARDFAKAIEIWQALAATRPKDKVLSILIERARDYHSEPPAADWNGTYVAKEK